MSNIPEYSVSEFSKTIKMVVEDSFGYVKIKGEISGFKKAASGHLYFSLKEDDNVLAAVCFKDAAEFVDFDLEDGLEVVASGRVTVYGARSNYQIIVEKVQIAGLGAIMEMLEKRRKKLEQEGLFDEIHKQEIPFFAKKIGVITSSSGAVIKDILHRVEDRCPTEILLYNVAVQGKNAAKDVVKAIKYFDKMKGDERPDLLIIARGGGSVEDLLPFSDEDLVRTAFACKLPIISAIGHETDFSLLDFVADLRAPTPTAAAEMATILFDDLVDQVEYCKKRLNMAKTRILDEKSERFANLLRHMRKPKDVINSVFEGFEELKKGFNFAIKYCFERKNEEISRISLSKAEIFAKIRGEEQKISHLWQIFDFKRENITKNYQNNLENLSKLLIAKNYKEILKRGFALVKNKNGKLIASAQNVKAKDEIEIETFDGEFAAYVLDKKINKKEEKIENDDENIQQKLI